MAVVRTDPQFSLVSLEEFAIRNAPTHVEWYGDSRTSSSIDPARKAFLAAKKLFYEDLTEEERKEIWIKDKCSMKDVEAAVLAAQDKYERGNKKPKMQTWLGRCASRIVHYGNIMDVLVQHHPEYVSLAWGTMKFLFVAVVNHEELLYKISKAVSRIADVLPRAELHLLLYPTERMQNAVAQLYASIIGFTQSAIKWYKKGVFSKTISAIVNPYDLAFKDVVDDITVCSRRVDELANAAQKAEIRDLHITTQRLSRLCIESHLIVEQILHSTNTHTDNYHTAHLDSILSLESSKSLPSREESLEYGRSVRRRQRMRLPSSLSRSELNHIKNWLLEDSSSLLVAQAQGIKSSARNFAVDLLDVILQLQIPVIWALPRSTREDDTLSLESILKMLVIQTVTLNPGLCGSGPSYVSPHTFNAVHGEDGWFDILRRCIRSFERLFIIIDMGLVEHALPKSEMEYSEFVQNLRNFTQHLGKTKVKIVMLSDKYATIMSDDAEDSLGAEFVKTDQGRQKLHMLRYPRFRAHYALRQRMVPNKLLDFLKVKAQNGKENDDDLEV